MKKFILTLASMTVSVASFADPSGTIDQTGLQATQQQLVMIDNDLKVISAHLAQQEAAQRSSTHDPSKYCYFGDKAYSRGSNRDNQVCVRAGFVADGSPEANATPLQWVSAKDAAHGNY